MATELWLKEGKAVRGVEVIVVRPDGSRAYVMPYPTPVFDGDGKLNGGVNFVIDITERRRAERVENPDRLVTDDELLGAVWRDVHVQPGVLKSHGQPADFVLPAPALTCVNLQIDGLAIHCRKVPNKLGWGVGGALWTRTKLPG